MFELSRTKVNRRRGECNVLPYTRNYKSQSDRRTPDSDERRGLDMKSVAHLPS